jgi:hypothetical protein
MEANPVPSKKTAINPGACKTVVVVLLIGSRYHLVKHRAATNVLSTYPGSAVLDRRFRTFVYLDPTITFGDIAATEDVMCIVTEPLQQQEYQPMAGFSGFPTVPAQPYVLSYPLHPSAQPFQPSYTVRAMYAPTDTGPTDAE